MKPFAFPLAAALVALCAGCSNTSSNVMLNGARPSAPTNPEAVAIYLQPPEKPHRIIAIVESGAATDDYLSEGATKRAAVRLLKKEAAKIGADGVILVNRSSEPYGAFSVGSSTGTATSYGRTATATGTSTSATFGWKKHMMEAHAFKFTASR